MTHTHGWWTRCRVSSPVTCTDCQFKGKVTGFCRLGSLPLRGLCVGWLALHDWWTRCRVRSAGECQHRAEVPYLELSSSVWFISNTALLLTLSSKCNMVEVLLLLLLCPDSLPQCCMTSTRQRVDGERCIIISIVSTDMKDCCCCCCRVPIHCRSAV
jgi:hypothetical protein